MTDFPTRKGLISPCHFAPVYEMASTLGEAWLTCRDCGRSYTEAACFTVDPRYPGQGAAQK